MASMRHKRRRTCEAKRRFDREDDARDNLRNVRASTGNNRYTVYRCPFCHGWHIGRRSNRLMQSGRAVNRQKAKELWVAA